MVPIKGIHYGEINYIYACTSLISFKIKLSNSLHIIFNTEQYLYYLYAPLRNNILNTNSETSLIKCKCKYNYVNSIIDYLLHSSVYGSSSRFRLHGRGYKALPFLHTYLFKLGYPYVLFYTLPLCIKLKKKKKRRFFHRFIGVWPHETQQYLSNIKALRIPDVYCAKGIFKKSEYFVKKEGKKAFTL